MLKYNIEVTDTFGGEANYCWVNRYVLELPDHEPCNDYKARKTADLRIVKEAKKLAGWTGLRCETSTIGGGMEFTVRPVGKSAPCVIMFITLKDD